MPEEGFFKRWARLKASSPADEAMPQTPQQVVAAPLAPHGADPGQAKTEAGAAPQAALPTLDDARRLTPDADFSAFVAKGVDKSVQRLALKKLFTDPHFNVMDGLDIYMNDFNTPSPLTPAMLASLQHAQGLVARLLDDQQKAADEQGGPGADAGADEPADANEPAAIQQAGAGEEAAQAPRLTPQGNA